MDKRLHSLLIDMLTLGFLTLQERIHFPDEKRNKDV